MSFFSAALKKISLHIGGKEHAKVEDIRSATFAPSFYISAAFSLGLLAYSLFSSRDYETLLAIRLVAALVLIQQVYHFYTAYLRADKLFVLYGWVDLAFKVARLLTILLFIKPLGLAGVLVSYIVSYALSFIIGWAVKRYRFSFKFRLSRAKEMFWYGLPNTLYGALGTIFTSIDKLMLMLFFGRTMLGFYSFAVLVLEVITFIPANISLVMLPRQLERFGQKRDVSSLVLQPMLIISYLMPLVIGGAFIFSRPVVELIFPEYLPSLGPVYMLGIGAFFLSNIFMLENHIMSTDREKQLMFPKLMFLLLSALLNILFIGMGYGITGVALGTSIAYAAYFFYLAHNILRGFGSLMELAIIVVPAFAMAGALWLSFQIVLPVWGIAEALARYAVFLMFNIPLWLYLEKRTGFLSLAMGFVRLRL